MKEHKPTARKLSKARDQGQNLKSQTLTRVLVLYCGIIIIINMIPSFWVGNRFLLEYCFGAEDDVILRCAAHSTRLAFFLIFPVLGGVTVMGIAIEFFQLGWVFRLSNAQIKIDRINPSGGFKKILSGFKQGLTALPFVMALMLLGGVITWYGVEQAFTQSFYLKIPSGEIILFMFLSSGTVLISYALADYFFKRKDFMKEQSMSTQEVREELRESEGDVSIKQQRRLLHEEIAMQDIIARVKSAKVIIVERAP